MISFFKSYTGYKIKSDLIFGIAIGILLLVIFFIRFRLLNVPLERDEGEYAYMGQLILQKISPYDIAYNMKFPGVYYLYAFFMAIFGQTILGIHFGLLIVNLISITILYLIVKKLTNSFAGFIAATSFAFMSISDSVLGFAGHATNYVVVFVLLALFILLKAIENEKKIYYFLSGIIFSITPILEQPAIFFYLFGVIFIFLHLFINQKRNIKESIAKFFIFTLAGIIPFIGLIISMKIIGVFDKFWFWTITYAADYINQVSIKDAISIFIENTYKVIGGYFLIWIIAIIGLLLIIFYKKFIKINKALIILFFVLSFCSIVPGLYFRSHYYIMFLPVISILFGIVIDYFYLLLEHNKISWLKWIPVAFFIISIANGIIAERKYLFMMSPKEISEQIYGYNPFVESPEIAKYIANHSNPDDKIAILGSEPQICFYANRKSATGYIYVYSLMENQRNSLSMQKEMISEIESGNPKFILFINVPYSWIKTNKSNNFIFDWMNRYINKGSYKLSGIVDLLPDNSIYKWGNDVSGYQIKSNYSIEIFEKIY
jgi:4-amino-4-deoxy-L-arabinose transferase-like glycosyltransferase